MSVDCLLLLSAPVCVSSGHALSCMADEIGCIEHALRATRANLEMIGIVYILILMGLGEELETLLMGTTVGMTCIARWALANESPCFKLHLPLRWQIAMVYVGDGDLLARVNIPIGEKLTSSLTYHQRNDLH